MAGGAVSFKIETLIQLVEGCNTRFVSPIALSNFAKKELEGYPEKLPVSLKESGSDFYNDLRKIKSDYARPLFLQFLNRI